MKIILGDKYILEDPNLLDHIKEVEGIGSYDDRKYILRGEPKEVKIIQDDKLLPEDAGQKVKEKELKEKVEAKDKEILKLQLDLERGKAITRITEECSSISQVKLGEYLNTLTYYWDMQRANYSTYREWSTK